jgi:hypothetical protein
MEPSQPAISERHDGVMDALGTGHAHRRMAVQLIPGVVLPGLIYVVVSRRAPVLVALAAASGVPALDAIVRLLMGKRPTLVGLAFLCLTTISVSLGLWLHSPVFLLAKGASMTAVLGVSFGVSAMIRRPLTRTFAVLLATDHRESRRRLAERWAHPTALSVFRVLAAGWAVLLLASAGQQIAMILTVSPGTVMALEPPVTTAATLMGVAISVAYVRRKQAIHADLALLPRSK